MWKTLGLVVKNAGFSTRILGTLPASASCHKLDIKPISKRSASESILRDGHCVRMLYEWDKIGIKLKRHRLLFHISCVYFCD